jgi:hypothetical protein
VRRSFGEFANELAMGELRRTSARIGSVKILWYRPWGAGRMRIEDQSRRNEVDPAGHAAGEADRPRDNRTGDIIGEIFDRIDGLLDLSVEEK